MAIKNGTKSVEQAALESRAPSKSFISEFIASIATAGSSLVSLLTGLLAGFLILYSGYVLYDTFYVQNQAYRSSWDLLQFKPEIIDDGTTPLSGAETLRRINEDYRSWLTVYDTKVDYPVVQGPDDLYYASHDVFGNSSITGAIYLATANSADLSDNYNLVYGHHMDNGAMFGALDDFKDADYFNSHREGVMVAEHYIYDLNVFAVIDTDAYERAVYEVGNRNLPELIDYIEAHAVQFDKSATEGAEKILALSTCANATTNGRLVVFATMSPRLHVSITLEGYDGYYDGTDHYAKATVTIPGTVIEYSIDNGHTWTRQAPSQKDVGSKTVYARATHPIYGTATTVADLIVRPAPVTVTVRETSKTYGTDDPEFKADVTGVVDGYEIVYSISRPGAGTDENAGHYEDAIIAEGAARQGNYTVTYVPADYTIEKSDALVISATGYTGIYDKEEHFVEAEANIPDGTVIEYSTDGGTTWTTERPSIINVGSKDVTVRASNPNYKDSVVDVELEVDYRDVSVTASTSGKAYGNEDPEFTATVNGIIDNFVPVFDVTRSGAGVQEEPGRYENVIIPSGDRYQGNYSITYVPADFIITPDDVLEIIAEGWTGTYDAKDHEPIVTVNVPEGTIIEYSTDGGVTWTPELPSIRDVGSLIVDIRARNPEYGPVFDLEATARVELAVEPADVYVTANANSKRFGETDPEFTATVSGVIDGYTIEYSISRPGAGTDESVGNYIDAIVPTGIHTQGNYDVHFVPASFRITPADGLTITAADYVGEYDGEEHFITAVPSITEGTVVEYSTDGGVTWSIDPPVIKDAGRIEVIVRATNPDYTESTERYILEVTRKSVIVRADKAYKTEGEEDPVYTARVEGLVGDDTIDYTVERIGDDEEVGYYTGVIVPSGEEIQGNYSITYVPGDLEILPAGETPPDTDDTGDTDTGDTDTTPPDTDTDDTETGPVEPDTETTEPDTEPDTTVPDTDDTPGPDSESEGTDTVPTEPDTDTSEPDTRDSDTDSEPDTDTDSDTDSDTDTRDSDTDDSDTDSDTDTSDTTDTDDTSNTEDTRRPVEPDTSDTTDPEDTRTPDTGDVRDTETRWPWDDTRPEEEIIDDDETPLDRFVREFSPQGSTRGATWALVNLICMIITVYMFLPLLHLKAKYGRGKLMKKVNEAKEQLRILERMKAVQKLELERIELVALEEREKKNGNEISEAELAKLTADDFTEEEFEKAVEKCYYEIKKFKRHFYIGVAFEAILSVLAVLLFIFTEDLRLPMSLIDGWTPIMILLMAACWLLDVVLARYRKNVIGEERKELEQEIANLRDKAGFGKTYNSDTNNPANRK